MKFEELEQRKGYIEISLALIKDNPKGIMKVLSKVLVMRAENDFMKNVVKYWCFSEHFQPLKLGEQVPQYQCIVSTEKGKIKSIVFERIEN